MQISNRRKALYITVSILISFIFWFYVNSDAPVEYTINNIPVEFINAESALANKGLMLVSEEKPTTVDLVLNMPRSMVYGFDAEHVRVISDLASVTSTGTQMVTFSIAYPSNINRSQIIVRSPGVQTINVRIGELFRKNVDVRCKLVGNVADGYVAGSVQLLPETLEIWGRQSDVMQVSYAQVRLNIQNAKSTIVELVEYEFYDHNDRLIEQRSDIHAASDTIQVTMPVIAATDVPLVVSFVESPGVRIGSFDVSLDTDMITLSGDANQIAQLGEIILGTIDLTEIDGEQSFTYDIPIPEGLKNLSGVTTATLTIRNRSVGTKTISVTNFGYENFASEERKVEVVTSTLDVTLRAPQTVLDAIGEDAVQVIADLSGVNDASGTYTVPAIIRVDGDPDVGTLQSYQLTVRISMREPDDTTEGNEQQGEGQGSEQDDTQDETGAGSESGTHEG